MPIKAENKPRYPKDWKQIRAAILTRAGGGCEWPGCQAVDRQPHPVTGSLVVLTVAHLDHTPEHCSPANLLALCQLHHLRYDAQHHAATASRTRVQQREAAGQLALRLEAA